MDCIHEACHAVVARALGLRVTLLTLCPGGGGGVSYDGTEQLSLLNRATVTVAGIIGPHLLNHLPWPQVLPRTTPEPLSAATGVTAERRRLTMESHRNAKSDLSKLLDWAGDHPEVRSMRLGWAEDRATELLRTNEWAVLRLATALRKRATLLEPELRRLLKDVRGWERTAAGPSNVASDGDGRRTSPAPR